MRWFAVGSGGAEGLDTGDREGQLCDPELGGEATAPVVSLERPQGPCALVPQGRTFVLFRARNDLPPFQSFFLA